MPDDSELTTRRAYVVQVRSAGEWVDVSERSSLATARDTADGTRALADPITGRRLTVRIIRRTITEEVCE